MLTDWMGSLNDCGLFPIRPSLPSNWSTSIWFPLLSPIFMSMSLAPPPWPVRVSDLINLTLSFQELRAVVCCDEAEGTFSSAARAVASSCRAVWRLVCAL